MPTSDLFKVVIVGSGSAAFEAAFRLRRLGEGKLVTTMLTPDEQFLTRSLMTAAPFSSRPISRVAVSQLAATANVELVPGRMTAVDAEAHVVLTESGEGLNYDALLIAIGGAQRAPYPHGLAFGLPGTIERMHGLVQDLESGYVRNLAFIVPAEATWPVPIYELALMSAGRAYDQCMRCALTIVTHEDSPLALFGPKASKEISGELARLGIEVHTRADVSVPGPRTVEINPGGDRLTVDRVITIPLTDGPDVPGLVTNAQGFLPVDEHGRVIGATDVYAAGDVTDFQIKQGGLACQQAVAASEAIAAQAGVPIEPRPYAGKLEGVLFGDHTRALLSTNDDATDEGELGADAAWWHPIKLGSRELAEQLCQA